MPPRFWIRESAVNCGLFRLTATGAQSLLSLFWGHLCLFSWVGCVFLFWVTCVLSLLSKQQARTKTLLGQPWAFGLGLLFLGLRPGSTPVFFHSGFGVGLLLLRLRPGYTPFKASVWVYFLVWCLLSLRFRSGLTPSKASAWV